MARIAVTTMTKGAFMTSMTLFPFNKVTHLGFGISFLIILTTLGVSFWGLHQTVGIFESVIHTEEVSDELLRRINNVSICSRMTHSFLNPIIKRFKTPKAGLFL
jgi:hypothetical protein